MGQGGSARPRTRTPGVAVLSAITDRAGLGLLGDLHGDFESLGRVMRRHPRVAAWLCVGDVGGDEGHYESPPAPLHWIKGNNEDFDRIAELVDRPLPNLFFLPNAVRRDVGPVVVAGLGGTHAPSWYDTPPSGLPCAPRRAGAKRPADIARDKRRHFVREEVERCAALTGVDIFLTHEAARPYFVAGRGARPIQAGKPPINEVLAAMRPRLHVFGHHHRFSEQVREGIPSLGLDLASRSYVLVDVPSVTYERLET